MMGIESSLTYTDITLRPKKVTMIRTIEVETSMFDIEYPPDLDHLSDDELAELADDDWRVHYVKPKIKLGDEVANYEGTVSGVVYRIEDEFISFIDEHDIRYRMARVKKCHYMSLRQRFNIIKKYKIGLTLVRSTKQT